MIYLDYNASVPLRPSAKEAMLSVLDSVGNASSPHTLGRKLRSSVEGARKDILAMTHAKRLVFTSGGTEANTLALSGLGSIPLLVSAIEHDSVLKGAPTPHIVPVTKEGLIDLEQLEILLSSFKSPGLLSLMLVNNETGVIQPIQKVAKIAHAKGWKIHTDASQALGHIPFSFEELGVDLMTLSSHKCGGPTGVGALLMKEDIQLKPLIPGGGQEFGMRSGTLSAPLILGFAAALKEALQDDPYALSKVQQRLEASLAQATIYGKNSPRISHVSCIGMQGVTAEFQVMAFDLKNIAVSAGSACSSGKMKTSHVLLAMGIPPEEAKCAIRISMGWKTTEADVDAFIQAWQEIYTTQNMKEAI
ncbi:MAG: cysteine desulfurase [Alphaproteobacteria bacterium]|nr:cysteine desulfurase [Alphaproteobacteria bacterium]